MSIRAIFQAGQTQITVNGLHQWDYGRKLEIQADDLQSVIEVHFACAGMTEAVVRTCVILGGVAEAAIPDQCLEQTTPITAWVYAVGDTSGTTTKTITLPIIARTKPQPAATVPTDFSDKYTEAIVAFNDAVDGLREGQLVALEAEHAAEADHASTATRANHATSADSAALADHATNAGHATSADSATNANHAKSADQASHATQAEYASRFAQTAVVPRAEVATLAEGVVDEIDGEPVYVPRAEYATNAGSANSAQSADTDKNGSRIDLSYVRNPIKKKFTNTTLASAVQLGVLSEYDKFGNITTLTIRTTLQDSLEDRVCVFVGDVYGAQGSGGTTEERTNTMRMVCTQAIFSSTDTFYQYTIGISGSLVLDKETRKLSFVADSNAFIRKYRSVDGSTDTDEWTRVNNADFKVESVVVSFA